MPWRREWWWLNRRIRWGCELVYRLVGGDAGADGGQEGGGDVSVKRRIAWGRVGEVE